MLKASNNTYIDIVNNNQILRAKLMFGDSYYFTPTCFVVVVTPRQWSHMH